MQKEPPQPETTPELSLNVIRVETALSRYPVHRLAKKGHINIELHQENERGETTLRWEVTHNSKYGQPGPLAYKLDTLIVNRRIDEAPRPVPRMIKLGSLRDICRELGKNEGTAIQQVKHCLHQNAYAAIDAKIRYRQQDGTEQTLEAGFTRYDIVFTGQNLPGVEGSKVKGKKPEVRKADAVYIILSDIYMQVINSAIPRPLDYDYLKHLTPGSQRFYELLSYQMYAALKWNRSKARLTYSEFCTYAPQTRYLDFDHVKKQMYKIHSLHRKSGYIESVEFESSIDREGNADWVILYTPGPKARAEYRAFTNKSLPCTLESDPPTSLFNQLPEMGGLEKELTDLGVHQGVAIELVRDFPEARIRKQLELLAWKREKKGRDYPAEPAGYLVEAIRKDYNPPKGYESKSDRLKRVEAKQEQTRLASLVAFDKRKAEETAREQRAQISSYLKALSPEMLQQFDVEALQNSSDEGRSAYEQASPVFKQAQLGIIRRAHVRKLLNLPASLDD